MDSVTELGRRLREIRSWRGLSLRHAAELSGISYSYLAQIERGEKAVNSSRVLEALANTLRVAPAELTGTPYAPSDVATEAARAAIPALDDTLTGWWLGDSPDAPLRPWRFVCTELDKLNEVLRPNAEYAEQAAMLPRLIRDLLAAAGDPRTRRGALFGLLSAYKSAAYLTHDLGCPGLPTLSVERMRQTAEALDDPMQIAEVGWRRAHLLSGASRIRQYDLAVKVADAPESLPHMRGMAHLTAALAAATQGWEDTAQTHLTEAAGIANVIDTDDQPWTQTDFGRSNVGIWRVSIAVELGHGALVAEIAPAVRPADVPPGRQATFWMDYGRGLLTDRKTRDRGISALVRAEQLAPQKIRNNVFVREAVADQLRHARHDTIGRDLRGLAWRMGVAPIG
jgi:transcriptional regulator with XRE-family HTH domain